MLIIFNIYPWTTLLVSFYCWGKQITLKKKVHKCRLNWKYVIYKNQIQDECIKTKKKKKKVNS